MDDVHLHPISCRLIMLPPIPFVLLRYIWYERICRIRVGEKGREREDDLVERQGGRPVVLEQLQYQQPEDTVRRILHPDLLVSSAHRDFDKLTYCTRACDIAVIYPCHELQMRRRKAGQSIRSESPSDAGLTDNHPVHEYPRRRPHLRTASRWDRAEQPSTKECWTRWASR